MSEPTKLKKIAVLTSGGDAPGMNACIRAVVRTAICQQIDVIGVYQGFQGLKEGLFCPLELGSVANIIQRGGTFLKTGRCPDFVKPAFRKLCWEKLVEHNVQGLVVIGGDGSLTGAEIFAREFNFLTVGIPGTIDNDIAGTDYTIGFDTAVNTALDAIDKIRDTAASHDRLFIIEVMGRESGYIALEVGLAGGAEDIFIPEAPAALDTAIQRIQRGIQRGKKSSILITAEGQKPGRAYDLAEAIRKKTGFEAKVCVLGHIQRGGSPTARDRNLASRLGAAAVRTLLGNHSAQMVGIQNNQEVMVPIAQVIKAKNPLNLQLLQLVRDLSI